MRTILLGTDPRRRAATFRIGPKKLVIDPEGVELVTPSAYELRAHEARPSAAPNANAAATLPALIKQHYAALVEVRKGRVTGTDGNDTVEVATPRHWVRVSAGARSTSLRARPRQGPMPAQGLPVSSDVAAAVHQVAPYLLRAHAWIRRHQRAARQRNAYPFVDRLHGAGGQHWRDLAKPSAGLSSAAVAAPAPLKYEVQDPRPNDRGMASRIQQYGVVGRIGDGGFGEVWEAVVTPRMLDLVRRLRYQVPRRVVLPLGARVALKFQFAGTRDNLERAIRESQIHVRLYNRTAGVVPRLYASGYDDAGMFVSVMDLVSGEPLHKYLLKHPKGLQASVFVRIERAVIAMWRAGIAHVDLNPKNIMIRPNGRVTIIDFGLSLSLPPDLVPASDKQALDQAYQQRLLDWMTREKARNGTERAAVDPHVLRWLYWQVRDKQRVPRLRALKR